MIKQRIEMKLPDETLLIAEATEDSDYPCISIYHKDAECGPDEVVFAEYNPEKQIGRKIMAGAYQNNDDDTRYYKPFHYAFKPSFKELYQVFTDSRMNDFCLVRDEDFYEIIRNYDNLAVCRDFSYGNEKFGRHTGHKITLAGYGGENGIENLSLECLDCNEVLYSVDRVKPLKDVYRMMQPNSLSRVVGFVNDNDKLKECGCIGFSKISFEPDGKQFKSEWTDKNEQLRTEEFTEAYNELVNDYLSYNLLKSAETMRQYCTESEYLLNFRDGKYVTQVVADDYTFFVYLIPDGNESKAQIFAYANDNLYKQIEPPELKVPNIDCEATASYVKHLDRYQNPKITSLDKVEDECWELFKEYAGFVGVKFGDGIDYSVAKEISEKIISMVERTFGVDFPMCKGG